MKDEAKREDWYEPFFRRLFNSLNNILNKENYYSDPSESTLKMIREYNVCLNYVLNRRTKSNMLNEKYVTDRMKYEIILAKRDYCSKDLIVKNITNASPLNKQQRQLLINYLDKCISLHNSIEIRGIAENIIEFVDQFNNNNNYYFQLSSEDLEILQHELNYFHVPIGKAYLRLEQDCTSIHERSQTLKLVFNDNNRKQNESDLYYEIASLPFASSVNKSKHFVHVYDSSKDSSLSKWTVILGDPGSGKTTFARCIALKQAHIALDFCLSPTSSKEEPHIPILIRIGEFAHFLQNNKTSSLFEYIGQHTWFGNSVFVNQSTEKQIKECCSVLQRYVINGKALIILDGLDEVHKYDLRLQIVRLVKNFADMYVLTSNFVSGFDNITLCARLDILPNGIGGNQLIVTSCIVGYYMEPLNGDLISHYVIQPMNYDDITLFVKNWFANVFGKIIQILQSKLPQLKIDDKQPEQKAELLVNELKHSSSTADVDHRTSISQVISNPLLLSIICTLASQRCGKLLPTQRIHIYSNIVKSILKIWQRKILSLSDHNLNWILSDLATYLHQNSSSGLIDELDLKRLCYKSLKVQMSLITTTIASENTVTKQVDEFMDIIRHDDGIIAARGERVYGFVHLTFQEYFTCMNIVKTSLKSIESTPAIDAVINRFLYYIADVRYREPLILALGWISWLWSNDEYNLFCLKLLDPIQEPVLNQLVPRGALLLLASVDNLVHNPSETVVYRLFDCLLKASCINNWTFTYPYYNLQLKQNIKKFSSEAKNRLVKKILSESTADTVLGFSTLLSEILIEEVYIPVWCDQEICKMLESFLIADTIGYEYIIDQCLTRISAMDKSLLSSTSNQLQNYFLTSLDTTLESATTNSIPSSLLTILIALYGGLYSISNEDDTVIKFSPTHIHRNSALSKIIIQYLADYKNMNSVKLEELTTYCKQKLKSTSVNDESLETIDLFIVLLCLEGVEVLLVNESYYLYKALHLASHSLKRISYYLRQTYIIKCNDPANFNSMLRNIIDDYMKVNKINSIVNESEADHFFTFFQSIVMSFYRLTILDMSIYDNTHSHSQYCLQHLQLFERIDFIQRLMQHKDFMEQFFTSYQQYISNSNFLPEYMNIFCCCYYRVFDKVYMETAEYHDKLKITEQRHPIEKYKNDPFYLIAYTPKHFQHLYKRLILSNELCVPHIKVTTQYALPYAYLLTDCLLLNINDGNIKNNPLRLALFLVVLQPILCSYRMSSFTFGLLWKYCNDDEKYKRFWYYYDKFIADKSINKLSINIVNRYDKIEQLNMALIQERCLIQDALNLNDEREADLTLYTASLFLAQSSTISKEYNELRTESQQTVLAIKSRILKVCAFTQILIIIKYSYSNYYDCVLVNDYEDIKNNLIIAVSKLPSSLSPLLYAKLVIHCIEFMNTSDVKNQLIDRIISGIKTDKINKKDHEAILDGLLTITNHAPSISAKLLKFLSECTWLNSENLTQIFDCYSFIFKDYLRQDHMLVKSEQTVFVASLYLVQLSVDVDKVLQFLQTKSDNSPFVSDNICISYDPKLVLKPNEDRIITYNQIQIISKFLDHCQPLPIKMQTYFQLLTHELRNFETLETTGYLLVDKWLNHFNIHHDDSILHTLACYDALLLPQIHVCKCQTIHILCYLLSNDDNYFSSRAHYTLSKIFRLISNTNRDVILALLQQWIYYQTKSANVTSILTAIVNDCLIDAVEDLSYFMSLELDRIRLLSTIKSNGINFVSTNDKYKEFQLLELDLNVSIVDWMTKFTSETLKYFIEHLELQNSYINTNFTHTNTEIHQQYLISLLIHCGKNLLSDSRSEHQQVIEVVNHIMLTNKSLSVQQCAAFILGFCRVYEYKKNCLYKIIKSVSEQIITGKEIDYSDELIAMCIRSHYKFHQGCDNILLSQIRDKYISTVVAEAAEIELVRSTRLFNQDTELTYKNLMISNTNFYDNNNRHHEE
ncbi:unnamed protein product, partial [Didymodactylos carnosus]